MDFALKVYFCLVLVFGFWWRLMLWMENVFSDSILERNRGIESEREKKKKLKNGPNGQGEESD